jgi:hypothetical protein
LLLAANGYGTGAQKILRVLYEHTVTARYIDKHRQEAERFWLFGHYAGLKNFERAKIFWRNPIFSDDKREALQSEWDKVRSLYPPRPRSWSCLDLLSMAQKTEEPQLLELYSPCADEPNTVIHPSSAAILSPVEETPDGRLVFTAAHQTRTADKAFRLALVLLYFVLDTLNSHFNLSLDDEINQYFESISTDARASGPQEA